MLNRNKFRYPDSIYRSAPFWALNDLLEPKELTRQIHEFKKQGMGGTFLHPRGGMATQYLSESYFEAIRGCIQELDKLDMIAWLYDEDRYPSGAAGGKVVKANARYRSRFLVPGLLDAKDISADENLIAVYQIMQRSYLRVQIDSLPESGEMFFISLAYGKKEPRFDCESYIDVCNKEAIDTFIKITHDAYYQHFKEYFGKTIPAIFSDEVHFRMPQPDAMPWTEDFEKKFSEKYKYDILDKLPDLFFDFAGCEKTRFDFWSLISGLFVEAYSKNIYTWCENKGIAFTGHFWEHIFPDPSYGASVMPHYEYMQYPGIDMLFVSDPDSPEMFGNDFIVKEASSVANQLGKERILSETNGASGWGLDFKFQKRALDWQLALGINLFCEHLSLYSLKGYRKRDYPLSFLDQQPWWKNFRILGDYIGRMSYALSQGKYQTEVLVLHSLASTWTAWGRLEKKDEVLTIADSVKSLVKNLNQVQVMFDLGDEGIISRHGKVDGRYFTIGDMSYRVVILPEMRVLSKKTFTLLKELQKNGGIIVSTGNTPTLLDGEYSHELHDFFENPNIIKIQNEKTDIKDFLEKAEVEGLKLGEVSDKDISNVYCHIRKDGEMRTVFVCNLDMDESFHLEMQTELPYYAERFDAESGEANPCDINIDSKGKYIIPFTLEPLNSALFMINENRLVEVTDQKEEAYDESIIGLYDWSVELRDPNAMNLQFCRAAINGEPYGQIDDVLSIDNEFKEKLGLEKGDIFARQPWMYTQEEKKKTCNVRAEYVFNIGTLPSGSLMAAAELPDVFSVFINDIQVKPMDRYYKDRAFVLYDIKEFVRAGDNILRIQSDKYGVLVNLESVYIVGDFRLSKIKSGYLLQEPDTLKPGNIVGQGYPYYSGSVAYSTQVEVDCDFDRACLEIEDFYGVTYTVYINGKKCTPVGWKPYLSDLTDYMVNGTNSIIVEVENSLQNLLGPFGSGSNVNQVRPGDFYAKEHVKFLPVGFDGKAAIKLLKHRKYR